MFILLTIEVWATETFSAKKNISMAFWRNGETIIIVHIVENVYISVIIFVFINNCPLLLNMS